MQEFKQFAQAEMEIRQRENRHRQAERNAVEAVVREAKTVITFRREKRERN